MKLKVFTLRLDPATGRFDDREIVEFQAGKDVLDVSEYQFVHDRVPTWGLLVRYRDAPGGRDGRGDREEPRKDWRADLDAEAARLYDELRLWRGRQAKRDGMPPYIILNNRELAEVAARRPATLTALREINGVGEAKAERWGEEILAVVAAAFAAQRPAEGEGTLDAG
ncbi:MAG: HRDC domain-containing protein [Deltaproteobacteria bacterium]|nr:HRDC domain-containing protein [Deltaproteobacteria bacterium]